jgi:hypothetical protein
MHLAYQPGSGAHAVLGEPEPVVGRREALDERQDLAALLVDAQEPRRTVEAAALEVQEQPVNPVGAGLERPPHSGTDTHHPWVVTSLERHLIPCLIHACHDRRP